MNAKWGVPSAAATALVFGALFILDSRGSTALPDPSAITPLAPRAALQGADGTVHGRYLQISPEEVPEALALYQERNWLAQRFDRDGQQALLEGSSARDR